MDDLVNHPFPRVFDFRDNTYLFFSHSNGNFFAVKEVSLLDDRSQGKQSIFQLRQVRGLGLPIKLHYIIYFSSNLCTYYVFFSILYGSIWLYINILAFHTGNISFESVPAWQHRSISRHRQGMLLSSWHVYYNFCVWHV